MFGFNAGLLYQAALVLATCTGSCRDLSISFLLLVAFEKTSVLKGGWWTENHLQTMWNFTTFNPTFDISLFRQASSLEYNEEENNTEYDLTHWIGRPAELPEWLRCVAAVDLQNHAGSRTQLGHHTLQVESRVRTINNEWFLLVYSTWVDSYVTDSKHWNVLHTIY